MNKTTRFKTLLESPRLECILEAHNGLSARVCEEAGFLGIWASGLCLSAQFGVRDSNEASWTQILEMLEFMADATSIPILLDGDTGYGNFNNLRRLVRKLEQRGIAAVCIEDKLFPKTNSFLDGGAQPLAEIDEFCGKLKAGKDAQTDDDFCVIARTEALIAGWGLGEALRRAEAYVAAGADAILIHSASSTPGEVLAFKSEWADRSPVVIVPTKYYSTPTEVFEEAGFSLAIWANHLLRAGLVAMQRTARLVARDRSIAGVEARVAPLSEVFRLQGVDELRQAEGRFLPNQRSGSRTIVLAASRGSALGELTADRPKTMVELDGEPLLAHIVDAYNASGVKDVVVVRGYAKEAVDLPGIRCVDNDEYATTGELHSLRLALREEDPEGDLYVGYGDVLFPRTVLEALGEGTGDVVIPVDTNWRESINLGRHADFVSCSTPLARRALTRDVRLRRVAPELPAEECHGEWMGVMRIQPRALGAVREEIDRLLASVDGREADLARLLNVLVERGLEVGVVYTTGAWLDVDTIQDLRAAERLS